ncbi:hypothetical protein V5O48_009261 [Marasmius crinis-equi]|uniref:Uncharacterized protein n=1 Tax=Marasmius crinis-equi TaxID=585013 RepID=A0ABR3FBM3_9AGAR
MAGLKKINDPVVDKSMSDVASTLEKIRTNKLVVKASDDSHMRGEGFIAAATGWSMGQGQQTVTHTARPHEAAMQELIREPCMKRLAAVQDGE